MQQGRAVAEMGIVLNPHYVGEWPAKIGSFILNFGAIELLTYQQLKLLEATHEDFVQNLDQPFGRRVKRIKELLEGSAKLNEKQRAYALRCWDEALDLAIWRNRIAHNPVLPTWKPGSDPERSPPDVLGVPDFRQFKEGNESDSIPLEVINKLIDGAADLARRLHGTSSLLQDAA